MTKTKILTLAIATATAGISLVGTTTATTSDFIHEGNGLISICDPNDSNKCITMMDKNLGATSNDITSPASYGNHYQWGNNHGFQSCLSNSCGILYNGDTTGNTQVACGGYNPTTPFDSNIFRIWNADYCTTATRNDNLWGGGSDGQPNRGYDTINNKVTDPTDRKGPCPIDYHVPSAGERSKLVEYYVANYDEDIVLGDDGDGLKFFNTRNNDSAIVTPALAKMQEDLKIPFAGYRGNTDVGIYGVGDLACLWSSSPNLGYEYAIYFYLNPDGAGAGGSIFRANGYSVRCFKDEPLKFIPLIESTDSTIQVTIGETEYGGLPDTMEVTTEIEEESIGRNPVVGEVKVDFGENVSAKFNKLVQINIPVEDEEQVIVKVKHAGSSVYNFDGLTLNRNASCNDNGRPISSQYNGEIISVVDGFASIYTCEASSFVALGLGSGEAIGEVTLTLTAGENTCTLNDYNLGTHNVSSEDQNVSTSGQNIVCEFLKNTSATIQLSMGDLVDGTKEISRQNFTGVVSSLGNPLGTIANLTGGSYNFSGSHIIYTKQANTIGTWTGSLAIEGIIPAGTPSGEYTGELNIIICEGCKPNGVKVVNQLKI